MFRQEKVEKYTRKSKLHIIVLENIIPWKITEIKNLCFYVLQILLNTTNQFQQILFF